MTITAPSQRRAGFAQRVVIHGRASMVRPARPVRTAARNHGFQLATSEDAATDVLEQFLERDAKARLELPGR